MINNPKLKTPKSINLDFFNYFMPIVLTLMVFCGNKMPHSQNSN